jgi:hypothetical protein
MRNLLSQHRARENLAHVLTVLPGVETEYELRYEMVLEAMYYAARAGYRTGYRIDSKEPAWPVAFIELPTGQVSWHMSQFPEEWDGHNTAQKLERMNAFVRLQKAEGVAGESAAHAVQST